ncbi:MAG TPA: hypothetical protein VF510_01300 [Ktedonobacterales bacterium]
MSYIDTFDHELVGFFAGLPLYHPLEAVVGSGGDEFGCTPDQLVLGGGDGEHPAMIVTEPATATLSFLQSALPPEPLISERSQDILDEACSRHSSLMFAGWGIAQYAAFQACCTSPAFVTPYEPERDGLLEGWILANIGEFVYFAMPALAGQLLAELADVCALVREPRFFNVLILPPGYSAPAGRYRSADGDVIWGNYAWTTARHTRGVME